MTDLKITADQWLEINKKLAEFMGWTGISPSIFEPKILWGRNKDGFWQLPTPAYHTSLDLIAEVEAEIIRKSTDLFNEWLDIFVDLSIGMHSEWREIDCGFEAWQVYRVLHASAPVRAYAAFLAIGGKLE